MINKLLVGKYIFPRSRGKNQKKKREKSNYEGYASHSKWFQAYDLEVKKIKIIYLVAHTSHLLQPLDLAFFSLQKNIIRKINQSSRQITKNNKPITFST